MRKKLLAALLAAIMLLTACGFIAVDDAGETVLSRVMRASAHSESEQTPAPSATPMMYTDVQIQTRLIELGFLSGNADGIFGPRSTEALQAFQTFCGFDATGEKDAQTLSMLFGDESALPTPSPTPLANGARDDETNSTIADIQNRLIELDYLSGTADGIFGTGTENAIRDFQEANGLEVTGAADATTLSQLNAVSAIPKPTPEPTPRVRGARGDEIKLIQEALRVMGFMSGDVDGDFGNETETSVKRYQQYVHERAVAYYEANPTPTPIPTIAPTPEPTPEPTTPSVTAGISLLNDSAQPEVTDEPIVPTVEPTATPKYEPDGNVTDELMADIISMKNVDLYVQDLARGATDNTDEVYRLQRRLASLWYLSSYTGIDGQYGKGTEAAVKYFQERNNLDQTGVADETTQRLMYSSAAIKSDRPANPYYVKISVKDQKVYVYEWVAGDYTKLVKSMVCSTGTTTNPTPYGTWAAGGPVGRWYYFKDYDCWAQYGYVIVGGIMFHSVLYSEKDTSTLRQGSVNALGSRASHGCIRLKVEDAKWIYNNCGAGTLVTVY